MEIFLAALVLVALCVFGLCFNIIFRKDGKFPETEIENNKEMRKRGIKCAKEEEMKLWGKKDENGNPVSCDEGGCGACGSRETCHLIFGPGEGHAIIAVRRDFNNLIYLL